MKGLTASHAGLLLIFIISAKLLGLNAIVDLDTCEPLGYSWCKRNDECCSTQCVREHHADKFGVCTAVLEPVSSGEDYSLDSAPTSDSDSSAANSTVRRCMEIGFDLCRNDQKCCSGFCSIEPEMAVGVCTRSRLTYESGVANLYEGSNGSISEFLQNTCRPVGTKWFGRHSMCCSGYFVPFMFFSFIGVCEIPKSLRPRNEDSGYYERGYCKTYWGVNRTMSGEQFDDNLLTAAHRTLPFNTMVTVKISELTHVTVRINDRTASRDDDMLQFTLRTAKLLDVDRDIRNLPCGLIILDDENCTPTMSDTCISNDECCSQNCSYRENITDPGYCIPHAAVPVQD